MDQQSSPSKFHLDYFPYHHDYYAHLLLKEEERHQICNYKARSPQVSTVHDVEFLKCNDWPITFILIRTTCCSFITERPY